MLFPENISHSDLVQLAERWLLKAKGCSFVLKELVSYCGEIPDAIGWRDGMSMLVECKASRSDFLSDHKKLFRKFPEQGLGMFRFFMCPEYLIQPEELPRGWGLVWVRHSGRMRQIIGPRGNVLTIKENEPFRFEQRNIDGEIRLMQSALRRVHLRDDLKKIYSLENSFDPNEWQSVEKVMPFCRVPKDGKAWLIFDGSAVRFESTHPSYWNYINSCGNEFDGPVVTHWRELPEYPK
jgi:hypothetical protein